MSSLIPSFFERIANQWNQVTSTYAVERQTLALAGHPVRLHLAGAGISKFYLPAVSHLKVDTPETNDSHSSHNRTDVFVWDVKETGIALPRADPNLQMGAQGRILNLPSPVQAAFNLESGVLMAYDPARRQAFVAMRDSGTLPPYERAAPLRLLFGWLGETHDFIATHAASVGWMQQAVLLAGRGGSGKSTTSLACLLKGFDFLGDDYVAVSTNSKTDVHDAPQVYSLYRSAKVNSRSLELHPGLRSAVAMEPRPNTDDKSVIWADGIANSKARENRLPTSLPLRALVLPRVTGIESRITRATPTQALAALAPSSIFQLAGAAENTLARLGNITLRLPSFHLELAPDGRAPDLIKQMVEHLCEEPMNKGCTAFANPSHE